VTALRRSRALRGLTDEQLARALVRGQVVEQDGWLLPAISGASDLTVSGNEITDAVRTAGTQGDGAAVPGGFGIWRSSTNLVANGGFQTDTTGWTAVGSTAKRDITNHKFGTADCEVDTVNAAAREGMYTTFTATAAKYTISAWVKCASGTVRLAIRDNAGTDNTIGNPVTMNGTWKRLTLTSAANLTAATYRLYVETDVQQNLIFYVDGVQAEAFPHATPYIETNGATATRAAARVQAAASLIDETQSWIAVRLKPGWANTDDPYGGSNTPHVFLWGDDTNNLVRGRFDPSTDKFRIDRMNGGAGGGIGASLVAFAADTTHTVICAWTSTVIKIAVDGAAFTSTANTNIPNLLAALWDIGSGGTVTANLNFEGALLWLACGLGTLTDANSATIAALSDIAPDFQGAGLGSGSAALTSMVWPALDADFVTPPVNTVAPTIS
jgi:hypothetical protein